jgi:hypothetical protein
MITTDVALLEAVGDCLESGDSLSHALGKVAMAGGAAGWWTEYVGRSVRGDGSAASALRATGLFEPDELTLLPTEGSDAAVGGPLHAVAQRRRRGLARRRAVLWSLVGPFAFATLTVLLDPLPNLVTDEPFLWPLMRGVLVLVILALGFFVGLPALLRNQRARSGLLRACSAVPGLRWFTTLYAEEELTTALVPFIEGQEVRVAGLLATSSLLAWSGLGAPLRGAAASARPASTGPAALPMGGLEPVARQLSLATNLAVLGGVTSKHLAQRLAQRGEAISTLLTARLRLAVRIVAYAFVAMLSISSLVGMISRGLPGMPTLPGGDTTPDQQQLEDLLKQLEK